MAILLLGLVQVSLSVSNGQRAASPHFITFSMNHILCIIVFDVNYLLLNQQRSEGPPSTDLTHVLPAAKAAISFVFPLNQELITPFLMKKDRRSHEKNNRDVDDA